MHQLQLIGIKTNLESFVTTTLMEHMLNRHQLHLFLWVSKQWGTSVSPIIFSISFSNTMYTILQMPQSASTSAFRAEVWALERKDQDSCAFFTGSGNYSRHWIAVGF